MKCVLKSAINILPRLPELQQRQTQSFEITRISRNDQTPLNDTYNRNNYEKTQNQGNYNY
jgi:hypothetical protein